MADLIDTNVLVYRYDPRDRRKQELAREFLRDAVREQTARLPHQAIIEFVAAVSRPLRGDPPLLSPEDARREAEELLVQFEVLYPNDAIVRLALRGAAAYQLPWFDAHLWAYAEYFGLARIVSEDFQHGRIYGAVRIHDLFAA